MSNEQNEQGSLFDSTTINKLSDFSQKAIVDSVVGLTEWGMKEQQPHVRTAILEYYNHLVDLYKKHGDYVPETSEA